MIALVLLAALYVARDVAIRVLADRAAARTASAALTEGRIAALEAGVAEALKVAQSAKKQADGLAASRVRR